MAEGSFDVHLELTTDAHNSMNFQDTYQGLELPWYKFETDTDGNVILYASSDGFEHLARYFLKMARTGKTVGYHAHHALEFGEQSVGSPELTIAMVDAPDKTLSLEAETAK